MKVSTSLLSICTVTSPPSPRRFHGAYNHVQVGRDRCLELRHLRAHLVVPLLPCPNSSKHHFFVCMRLQYGPSHWTAFRYLILMPDVCSPFFGIYCCFGIHCCPQSSVPPFRLNIRRPLSQLLFRLLRLSILFDYEQLSAYCTIIHLLQVEGAERRPHHGCVYRSRVVPVPLSVVIMSHPLSCSRCCHVCYCRVPVVIVHPLLSY